jgi:hypothetical protein
MPENGKDTKNGEKDQRSRRIIETTDGKRFYVDDDSEAPDPQAQSFAREVAKELMRLSEEPDEKKRKQSSGTKLTMRQKLGLDPLPKEQ